MGRGGGETRGRFECLQSLGKHSDHAGDRARTHANAASLPVGAGNVCMYTVTAISSDPATLGTNQLALFRGMDGEFVNKCSLD